MSRNDQVTRQWYLLRRLESPRGATLHELAETLPDDYPRHPRTVRRDLEALEAAGFPLVTERADGQTRWKLMDGYRHVPALTFSATELMALTFSRPLLKPLDGTQLHTSLDSALNKAAAALPQPGLAYVREIESVFSVGLGPHKVYREHRQTIDQLTRAITPLKDGRLRLTLEVADTPELVGWILSFRSGVRVVRPENLGERVREEARKILRG